MTADATLYFLFVATEFILTMSRGYKGRHWEVAIPSQPSCDVNTIPNPTCDQRMEKRTSVLNRKVSALSTQSLDDTEAEVGNPLP